MAGSLEDFYARLGDFAAPTKQVVDAEYTVNGELGAAGTIDATLAMSKVVTQYVTLSTQGETLRQMLTAGVKIPCDVWSAYASARQDYLTKSQYLFDQLSAKGVTVEQVIYSGGVPQLDPSDLSKVRTLRVGAPLRPPAFVGINQQCPTVPAMSGAYFAGTIGWEPVPMSLGSVASATFTALGTATLMGAVFLVSAGTPLGLAGYGSYKTIKQIAAVWEDYDASPARILVAYTSCFSAAVKGGLSATDAANRCAAVQTSANAARVAVAQANASASDSLGFWGWLGVGAGVVILGSIVLKYMRNRVGAAARLISPVGGLGGCPSAPEALDGVALGELYFKPKRRRRGRR
jgi:hypothetical protein